jgi:alpha-tubulin suppressor-like RCC1 family protein
MSTQRKGFVVAALLAFVAGLGSCGGGGGGDGSSAVESSGSAEPVLVVGVASAIAIATGWAHSCAVDDTGQAWCWGANEYGQLGCTADIGSISDGGIPYVDTPCGLESVPPMALTSIASAAVETCGLDLSGVASCWGYGIPLDPVREPIGPTPVDTTQRFTILRAPIGDPGMCGLSQSGPRYCWGAGETTAERLVPQLQDDSGLQFGDIALSQGWGCGVTSEVEAWCWGSNWFGQLGIGTVGQFEGPLESEVPVQVVGDRSYVAIAAGLMHVCALDTEGAAWCWGFIPGGTTYGTPQAVPGDHRFNKIFAGGQFTCGLTTSGQAWCWGLNFFGELGNGSYEDSLAPQPVTGGLSFSTLALGGIHACGITTDQQLYCWGSNEFGQLGRPL